MPLEDELASVCLCVTAKYNVDDVDKSTGLGKDIYFFEDGTVVFWNIPGTVHHTLAINSTRYRYLKNNLEIGLFRPKKVLTRVSICVSMCKNLGI